MKELEKLEKAREFIFTRRKQFIEDQKMDCSPTINAAIYLLDILYSLVKKIESACKEGHKAPLVSMMASSLEGFRELFNESYERDSEDAITSLSTFTTELYHVYRSSMYGIVEPQLLDGVSLFRDIPESYVEKYYNLIDAVSYIIRGEFDSEPQSKFFYLLVPGTIPSVMTYKLFCSLDLERRLLVISFPRIMLFQPKVLIPSLIHETAHYSGGDNERNREKRLETILDIISYYIIFQTGLSVSNSAFMSMRQLLGAEYKKIANEYQTNHSLIMLDTLAPILRKLIYRLSDPLAIKRWAKEATFGTDDVPEKYEQAYYASLTHELYGKLTVFVNCIMDIFSEAYADIVAVIVLNMTLEDYLFMLRKNGSEFKTETSFQERIQIVSDTCWPDSLNSQSFIKPNWLGEKYYGNIMQWRNVENKKAFPLAIREHIIEHFKEIYSNSFPLLCKGDESVLELRNIYHDLCKESD